MSRSDGAVYRLAGWWINGPAYDAMIPATGELEKELDTIIHAHGHDRDDYTATELFVRTANVDLGFDSPADREACRTPATRRDGWMPIESAPRGGISVLVFGPGWSTAGVCNWDSHYGEWFDGDFGVVPQPTHWQPLPEPPAAMLAAVEPSEGSAGRGLG